MGKQSKKISTKKIKQSAGIDDPEIHKMFNQLIGAENVDMHICYPIYDSIRTQIKKIRDLTDIVSESMPAKWKPDFVNYSKLLTSDLMTYMTMEFSAREILEWEKLSKEEQTNFSKSFNDMKNCKSVIQAIATCNNMHPYADKIKAEKTSYVDDAVGDFELFAFSKINLRYEFLQSKELREMMATYIAKFYKFGIEIYKQCQKPSVDIKAFSEMIKNILKKTKTNPKLHRLTKAFKVLENSMGLFEDNFNSYYHDFVQSKNPTSILQSFIIDVSDKGMKGEIGEKFDFTTLAQLKQVITHFQNLMANNPRMKNDPNAKKFFDIIDKQISTLDQASSNLKK